MAASARRRAGKEARRHLVLAQRRPILDARSGDEMDLRPVAAHRAGARRNVVGDDPVGALGAALLARVLDQVLRLGGKADDEARALRPGLCERREDVGIQAQLGARSRLLPLSSIFASSRPPRASRRRRRRKSRCRREGSQRLGKHLLRRLNLHHAHAWRIGQRHRAGDERHLGAERRRPRAPRHDPACRRSGWRYSAQDRSARASGPR